tara:strand:+ start:1176 stop:1331 length:156 start_codon:yes stop_codon:yes gene_type:complete
MPITIGGATPKSSTESGNSPSTGGASPKESSNTSPRAGNAPTMGGVIGTSK